MDVPNFRNKLATSKSQTLKEGVVKTRKAGRPKKPDQVRFGIRMPATVHEELKRFTAAAGIGQSAFIVQAIKAMMADQNARNKLLVQKFLEE